jgi:hypothetical protein
MDDSTQAAEVKKNTKKLINGLYPIDPSRLFGLVLFNAH